MTPEQQANMNLLVSQRKRFVAFAQSITNNLTLAEDVVQDCYLLAFRNIHQFTGDQPWKWMNQIIVNRVRSIWRREKWYTSMDSVPDPCLEPSGFDSVYIDQILEKVQACPNGHLLLGFAVGMEYSEVTQAEGIPEGTVKSRSFRARERLMAMLPEEA